MADTAGLLQIPVPTSDAPIGDPLLAVLLSFLQATLNAHAGDAWGSLDPSKPCVRTVSDNGPERGTFIDKNLPAIFLERVELGDLRWIAQDFLVRPSTLRLSWVMPSVSQNRQQARAPFLNALRAVFDSIVEFEGRDPSWIVPGDPDPRAAAEGSLLWSFAGLWSMSMTRTRSVPLIIRQAQPDVGRSAASGQGTTIAVYERIESMISVEELLDRDINLHYSSGWYAEITTTNPSPPAPALVTGAGRFV